MSSGITAKDRYRCDLPPLCGNFPLEDKYICEHLREPLRRMIEAVEHGAEVLILDLRGRENYDDVHEMLKGGVMSDSRFKGFSRLEDRPASDWHTEHRASFMKEIISAEEQGTRKKYLIEMGQEAAEQFNQDECFCSKLARLYPEDAGKLVRIPVPSWDKNIYAEWIRHALQADVAEYRRLFIEAASCPVQPQFYDCSMPRLQRPIINGKEFAVQPQQQEAFDEALRILQFQLACDVHLCLEGCFGTGKTEILQAAFQTQHQLGFNASYYHHAGERYEDTSNAVLVHGHTYTPNCDLTFQFHDQADRAKEIGRGGDMDRQRLVVTSNKSISKINSIDFKSPQQWMHSLSEYTHRSCRTGFVIEYPGPPFVKPVTF